MDQFAMHMDTIAQARAVARSVAELTHRAMGDAETSIAAADLMAFAAKQVTRMLEEFINAQTQMAHNPLAFAHTHASMSLDKAYADFECLVDAAGMIRLHGVGSHYTAHLTYLMRYAAESACSQLERVEHDLTTMAATMLPENMIPLPLPA